MEFLECVKTRRSVRRFTDAPVSAELVKQLVETASAAPSWKNSQVVRYTLISDRTMIDTMADEMVYGFDFNAKTMKSAPVLVVVSYVKGRSGYERDGSFSTTKGDRFEFFDAGIASQTFCLAAHDKGLGSVILGYYDEAKIMPFIHLPETQGIAAIIALGYPKFQPDAPERKSPDVLLTVL